MFVEERCQLQPNPSYTVSDSLVQSFLLVPVSHHRRIRAEPRERSEQRRRGKFGRSRTKRKERSQRRTFVVCEERVCEETRFKNEENMRSSSSAWISSSSSERRRTTWRNLYLNPKQRKRYVRRKVSYLCASLSLSFLPFPAFSFTASFVCSLTDTENVERECRKRGEREKCRGRERHTEDVLLETEYTDIGLSCSERRRGVPHDFLLILVLHHHQAGNLVPSTSPSREVSQFFTTWGRKEKSWRLFFLFLKTCELRDFSSTTFLLVLLFPSQWIHWEEEETEKISSPCAPSRTSSHPNSSVVKSLLEIQESVRLLLSSLIRFYKKKKETTSDSQRKICISKRIETNFLLEASWFISSLCWLCFNDFLV